MGRNVVKQGNEFKIEFDTGGGGSYYAFVRGAEKGPYASQDAAARYVASKLEGFLDSMTEVDQAISQEMVVEDQRNSAQELARRAGDPNWRDAGSTLNATAEEDQAEMEAIEAEREKNNLARRKEWAVRALMVQGNNRAEAEELFLVLDDEDIDQLAESGASGGRA